MKSSAQRTMIMLPLASRRHQRSAQVSDGAERAGPRYCDRGLARTRSRSDHLRRATRDGDRIDASNRIDKSLLALNVPRRYRNKDHLRFVAQRPCLLCALKPSDSHDLRFVQPRALGRKAVEGHCC
jgi:hypothetical protein